MGGNKVAWGGGSKRPIMIGGTTCFVALCFFGGCGNCTKSSLLVSACGRFLLATAVVEPTSSLRIFRSDWGDVIPRARSLFERRSESLYISSRVSSSALIRDVKLPVHDAFEVELTFCALEVGSSATGRPEALKVLGSWSGGSSSDGEEDPKGPSLRRAIKRGSMVVNILWGFPSALSCSNAMQ